MSSNQTNTTTISTSVGGKLYNNKLFEYDYSTEIFILIIKKEEKTISSKQHILSKINIEFCFLSI
jgi:hypothetical protein